MSGQLSDDHRHALQQLMECLRRPNTPDQQLEILQILKSNPALMATFIRQRQTLANNMSQQQQEQEEQNEQNDCHLDR